MEKRKILIVEDEFIIADVLRDYVQKGGYTVCGVADTVDEALEIIDSCFPDLVLLDIFLKGTKSGIDLAKLLALRNLPFIFISANSTPKILDSAKVTNPSGFVLKPFREKDVLVALDIAFYRHDNKKEHIFRQHVALEKEIMKVLGCKKKWKEKLMAFGHSLQAFIPYEFFSISCATVTPSFNDIGFLRIGFDEYQTIGPEEMCVITRLKLEELAALQAQHVAEKETAWYDEQEFNKHLTLAPVKKHLAENYNLRSHVHIALEISDEVRFVLNFYSRRPNAYDADHILISQRFNPIFVGLITTMLADPGNPYQLKVQHPVSHVEDKPDITFEGMVGKSHLLLNVFDQILQVAPYNTSVLILGESGTGKEKIAERLHHLSPRNGKPFVKVNCGALPAALIDSELFGHEKGAFTGAYERKLGRFEQANSGTIFLDEIGDLRLDSQVKLLRVLQEREFERLGGRGTIKVDVRIIAATNHDLEKEVAEGRFRLDLFYRLNVIQIVMPPLRERPEDIPLLAHHFLQVYNAKAGRTIKHFSEQAISAMVNYNWPGNIRELENLVERNVLLCRTTVIEDVNLPVEPAARNTAESSPATIVPMTENEKAHILAALRKCNGKIWGAGGAAALLHLPPTTLNSKMKKLGISKDSLE